VGDDSTKLFVMVLVLAKEVLPRDKELTDKEANILGSNIVKIARYLLSANVPMPSEKD